MPYVQSSALERASCDEAGHALSVKFRDSGRTYICRGVPRALYVQLMLTDSIVAYFNAHIRDRFDFEELEN